MNDRYKCYNIISFVTGNMNENMVPYHITPKLKNLYVLNKY